MFPSEILIPYIVAVLIVVAAPGPDNILAISRGLSQGPGAAALSSFGAGLGIMAHTVAATLGLTLVLQSSAVAFWIVKLAGAGYLMWLGYRAIRSRSLVSFAPADRLPLWRVFGAGFLSNVLNPKPGLFVMAFIPQFVSAARGSVPLQLLGYGAIFSLLTFLVFSVVGFFAARLSSWISRRPRVVRGINFGAGLTFLGAGFSVLLLDRKTT